MYNGLLQKSNLKKAKKKKMITIILYFFRKQKSCCPLTVLLLTSQKQEKKKKNDPKKTNFSPLTCTTITSPSWLSFQNSASSPAYCRILSPSDDAPHRPCSHLRWQRPPYCRGTAWIGLLALSDKYLSVIVLDKDLADEISKPPGVQLGVNCRDGRRISLQ